MERWIDGRMDGLMDGWLAGWLDGWMDEWVGVLTDGWKQMDGRMEGNSDR